MAAVTICSDFGAQKNKVSHCFPIYLPWSDGTGCHDLRFPTFSLSTFTFIKRLLSSSSLSAIRVVSSAYLRLLIFLPTVLIPACASRRWCKRAMPPPLQSTTPVTLWTGFCLAEAQSSSSLRQFWGWGSGWRTQPKLQNKKPRRLLRYSSYSTILCLSFHNCKVEIITGPLSYACYEDWMR